MEAQTCICIVKLFCLREDSKCHARHMQSTHAHTIKRQQQQKTSKPSQTGVKSQRTLVEKDAGLEDKSCGIDHAYAAPASARNKRGKLIFFPKFSVVKDDSHCLTALRWCVRKNGNMTEEKNSNNPPEPLGWSQGFITFEPLNAKKKKKKRKEG